MQGAGLLHREGEELFVKSSVPPQGPASLARQPPLSGLPLVGTLPCGR